ncbi:MAG TPA: aspartate aminotransferase family protein [Kiloniellales bacterium]|nr:aspartate aminotransferase family protein [Kiloniellales bacterium]
MSKPESRWRNERMAKDRFAAPDSRTARIFERGRRVIPAGTSRLHYLIEPNPIYAESGHGCRLTDADGDERIDCLNNMTALIHGHADPEITAAVVAQATRGVSYSEPCATEVELAELIVERLKGAEQVHFRSSGTEAVMIAVKLARAFTGRDMVAKFEGAYHGYYDYVQWSFTSGEANWGESTAPRSVPSSGGLASSVERDMVILPFNDPDGVERLLQQHGKRVAALLVEPLSNRSGMVLPKPGFFDFLREITRQHGIVLIFDEVIAFRVAPGGAQARYGGAPDLTALGKVIGGGMPIGAIAGRAEILGLLDPASKKTKVLSGGTYSGNPLSAAAGIACLTKLTPAMLERLETLGKRFRDGANAVLRAAQQPAQVTGDTSLFQVVPNRLAITNYRSMPFDAQSNDWLLRLHQALLREGVIISHRGLGCLSSPMDETVIDELIDAFERSVARLRDHAPA